jgi:hypothetical protein
MKCVFWFSLNLYLSVFSSQEVLDVMSKTYVLSSYKTCDIFIRFFNNFKILDLFEKFVNIKFH